jgi:hypothetical protein
MTKILIIAKPSIISFRHHFWKLAIRGKPDARLAASLGTIKLE